MAGGPGATGAESNVIWSVSKPFSLVNAHVVGVEGAIADSLHISGNRIVTLNPSNRKGGREIDAQGSYVFPGLINAHDHFLHNNYPRLKWREQYRNASEWISDTQKHLHRDPAMSEPLALPTPYKLLTSGLKNLLSGATSVCHHDPMSRRWAWLLLVRVVRDFGYSHSLYIDGGDRVSEVYQRTPPNLPWIIHAAEGTDARARAEIGRLDELGCLGPNSVLVHGIGATAADRRRLLEAGSALIWCPSSNQFLFGQTAQVREMSEARRLAVGSDSRFTGELDLLDELRVAAASGQIAPADLFRAVTVDAASILGLGSAGRLAPGGTADLVIAPNLHSDPFTSLLSTQRRDLELVMIGGFPLIATPAFAELFHLTRTRAIPCWLHGRPRLVARRVSWKVSRFKVSEPGFLLHQKEPARME